MAYGAILEKLWACATPKSPPYLDKLMYRSNLSLFHKKSLNMMGPIVYKNILWKHTMTEATFLKFTRKPKKFEKLAYIRDNFYFFPLTSSSLLLFDSCFA